jgi:hypothetical protein
VKTFAILVGLALFGCSRSSELPRPESTEPPLRPSSGKTEPSGFAVVELFTSEGCSSCPPADANLARIARLAERNETPVYVLSFHVDYWNDLGWRDPFSSADFSLRQRYYAKALGSGVYTPQMVVNGSTQLTGSDESGADEAVEQALKRPATANVDLRVKYDEAKRELVLGYRVEHAPNAGLLTLCIVQSSGAIDVRAGENSGRKLVHQNVVRAYETRLVSASSEGEWKTVLASEIAPGRARLMAIVQDSTSMGIVGAKSARL